MANPGRQGTGARPASARVGREPETVVGRGRAAGGLAARDVAVSALFEVFVEKRPFDDAFSRIAEARGVVARDRAFARLIATTVLRHKGALQAVLSTFIAKPLPEHRGRLEHILLSAAAQLLILKTPPHAAISLAVDQCRGDRMARRFANLANAVLRRVAESGAGRLAALDNVELTFPEWLLARWTDAYGPAEARQMARASLLEPALDLTVKADAEAWAGRLGGIVLSTGSVRLSGVGRVEELPGYDEGAWWVQDAAAALPVKLLGDVAGLRVLDLCAAPGGKTAQLAAAGAHVTAVDKSAGRLQRLKDNLKRLGLTAETAVSDTLSFRTEEPFDAVLLDAPCTATGTIRRHPDIIYLKRPEDVAALAALQERMLANAATLVKPGGVIVYCTCSLEPEEGERQIAAFLKRHPDFVHRPAALDEDELPLLWRTADGDLRTLPIHLADLPDGFKGIDGFFAAALVRQA